MTRGQERFWTRVIVAFVGAVVLLAVAMFYFAVGG